MGFVDETWKEGYDAGWEEAFEHIDRLRAALAEACQIALGTDLARDAVERIRELQRC